MTDQPTTTRKDDRLWGGRFDREPDKKFDAFQRSFSFDRRLLPYEFAVDRAWAKALQAIGILTEVEVRDTLTALQSIADTVRKAMRSEDVLARIGGSGRALEFRVFEAYNGAVGEMLRTRTEP